MKYYYFAVDDFGDRMRRFYSRQEATIYVKKRPGWKIEKEPRIIVPIVDWNNFEPAIF